MRIKNLKLKIYVLIMLISLVFVQNSHAQTPTKKPSTTPSVAPTEQSKFDSLNEKIGDLKERIASRVAELNLVEKRGIIGTVTEVSTTQITMTDIEDNTRIIGVDGITKFSSSSQKESFGISDISKGTKLSVIGIYNKQSRKLLGRYINTFIIPVFINGQIGSTNDDEFSLKILAEDGKEITVDVETVTKTSIYTNANGMKKAGFSKITPGDRISIVGFPDKKNPSRIVASRVLLLPELPKNPRIVAPNTSSESAEPTPLPTATLKPTSVSKKKLSPTP